MKTIVTIGASLALAAAAASASAETFTWWGGPDFEYRNDSNGGGLPVAAIGQFNVGSVWSVFLHSSSFFIVDVPGEGGGVSPNSEIAQAGFVGYPSIASVPTAPGGTYRTDVVQAEDYYQSGTNYLAARVGKWTQSGYYGTVSWNANTYLYDTGAQPNIAIGGSSYTQVVEVHTAGTGAVSPLYARTGSFTTAGIQWTSYTGVYDYGENPSVAIVPGIGIVVEVHQAQDGAGALMYRTATVSDSGQLTWSASKQYDHGIYPKIAISVPPAHPFFPLTVYEVHQGQVAAGPLWMHTGQLNRDGSITWGNNAPYTTGAHPSIAIDNTPSELDQNFGVEVHQGGANAGALWGHFFSLT